MAVEKPPETEASTEPTKTSKIRGLLPAIGGVVGGLALGATLGFTLLGPKLSSRKATPVGPTAVTAAENATTPAKEGGELLKKGEAAPAIYQLDNLVMNPAASGGSHFLLMSIALQVKDAGSLETLKGRDAELRDAILRLVSRKTIDQVSDISARDQLGSELITVMSKMFGNGTVTKIYFPQFVIQ